MSLKPTDMLPIGTKVGVKNAVGKVISADWKKDQFGEPIAVHTVKFDKKYSHARVENNKRVPAYKPYSKIQTVNYTAITVLDIP